MIYYNDIGPSLPDYSQPTKENWHSKIHKYKTDN